jgi:glycosyltransferase involved in cell wall biosynthesis
LNHLRVLAVYRHPTPYRDPLLDRAAALPGVDLEVLYLAKSFAETPWARDELAHRHRFLRPWLRFTRGPWEVGVHPQALLRLLRPRPDVLLLSGWADPTVLMLAAASRLLRIPYILGGESFEHTGLTGGSGRVKAEITRWMVRGASSWLPAGSRATEHFVGLGAERERCHPYPTSPDSHRWIETVARLRRQEPGLRERLGLPDDGVIVFVGRLVDDKAPEVLLEAYRILLERHPGWALVYVGDGPLRGPLAERSSGLPGVHLLGFLQPARVAELLAASDLFALPSRYETWGAVATEAAAAGLPVVVSENVGSGPDLLAGGECGERVPVDDAEALAGAIERWMERGDRRGALAARARERSIAWGNDLNLRSLAAALKDCHPGLPDETLEAAGA